jgi:glutamate 5-kinase
MQQGIKDAQRIVVKVGTSTLTHESGRLNIQHIDRLVRVLSDLKNAGKEVILVSSGAIGVGVGKLGLPHRPYDIGGRQAAAAVGQVELMYLYDKIFLEYGHGTAQVLLTQDILMDAVRKQNVVNTFMRLLEFGVIPVVNENDTVSTEEIEFGDNDTLSAIVAKLVQADALIILTDIDGLYTGDPRQNPEAVRIDVVEEITDDIRRLAGGRGSSRGTGGMVTKISAAEIAVESGIEVVLMDGSHPDSMYDLLEGKAVGTRFVAKHMM